jgi:RES domain-containing protein
MAHYTSWVLADEAIAARAQGIVFASTMAPGGLNLVIYTEALTDVDELTVYDPDSSLPKTQDSWLR